jgi:mono/diheme cytochrome c family protein
MKTLLILLSALLVPALAAQSKDSTAKDSVINPRARLFIARGCSECHGIEALKVKASRDVGPDLTAAYVDVPARYGVTLEAFFDEPAGIMRMVLASHVRLQPADADSLVRLFRDLYKEHLARLDSLQRQGRPVLLEPR